MSSAEDDAFSEKSGEPSESEIEESNKLLAKHKKARPSVSSSQPLVSFHSAKKSFVRLNKDLEQLKGRPKFNKREEKLKQDTVFKKNFDALEKEANFEGLDEETIEIVWQIASSPVNLMSKKNKAALIYNMVPNKPLSAKIVSSLFYWLSETREMDEKFRNSIKLPILDYMIVSIEYQLIDGDIFASPLLFSILMRELDDEQGLKTLCALIKLIAKREFLTKSHISVLHSCIVKSKKQRNSSILYNLYKIFRASRPDLISNDLFDLRRVDRTKQVDVVKPGLKTRFYEAKGKILRAMNTNFDKTGIDMDLAEKLKKSDYVLYKLSLSEAERLGNKIFFPEFAGSISDNESNLGKMLATLKNPSELHIFEYDPFMLNMFESWLKLNLDHKFNSYVKEMSICYEFIFDRCCQLASKHKIMPQPLSSWLKHYLYVWDEHLFQDYIFNLIPHLPFINLIKHDMLLEKFKYMFLVQPNKIKLKIWNSMSSLLINWIEKREALDSDSENPDPSLARQIRKQERDIPLLFDFLCSLVQKLFIIRPYGLELPSSLLLSEICKSFTQLNEIYDNAQVEVLPPTELIYMINLSECPISLEAYCHFYINCVQTQKRRSRGKSLIEKELLGFFKLGYPITALNDKMESLSSQYMSPEYKEQFNEKRTLLSVMKTDHLEAFRLHPEGNRDDPLEELFDMKAMEDICPCTAQCLKKFKSIAV